MTKENARLIVSKKSFIVHAFFVESFNMFPDLVLSCIDYAITGKEPLFNETETEKAKEFEKIKTQIDKDFIQAQKKLMTGAKKG